jgi:hypothetical protein
MVDDGAVRLGYRAVGNQRRMPSVCSLQLIAACILVLRCFGNRVGDFGVPGI